MVKTTTYPLKVEAHPAEGGFLAYFPALPGCQTWGDTYEAAVRNAEQALAIFIDTLVANGDPIPEPEPVESPISLGIIVRTPVAA